jgi:hypothetical protein
LYELQDGANGLRGALHSACESLHFHSLVASERY